MLMLDHGLPGIPGGPGGPGGPTMPLNSDPEITKKSKELVMAGPGSSAFHPKPLGQMSPAQPYLATRRGAPHRMFPASQGAPGGQEVQC